MDVFLFEDSLLAKKNHSTLSFLTLIKKSFLAQPIQVGGGGGGFVGGEGSGTYSSPCCLILL